MCAQRSQISLGICPVWSKSSLSAWRKLGSWATHWVHSEDSDQTGRMPRLIWVFAGRWVILLVLSWGGSNVDLNLWYSDSPCFGRHFFQFWKEYLESPCSHFLQSTCSSAGRAANRLGTDSSLLSWEPSSVCTCDIHYTTVMLQFSYR